MIMPERWLVREEGNVMDDNAQLVGSLLTSQSAFSVFVSRMKSMYSNVYITTFFFSISFQKKTTVIKCNNNCF